MKKTAKDIYCTEIESLGPEAALVDEIMQTGIGELISRAMSSAPTMTEAVGVAVVRALLLNAAAAAVRIDMPEDAFMRLSRSTVALARTLTREIDAKVGN